MAAGGQVRPHDHETGALATVPDGRAAGGRAPGPTPAAAAAARPRTALRRDIQGLRAVAVGLVIAFHAGVPVLAGGYVGVDVFFVVSGYLITGLILRELTATGHLDLAGFYARRIRRLLPATAVTFAGVAALTVLLLPVTRWKDVGGDLVASAAYLMNWRLADRSVDYLQQGAAASPLQHFWSLAVEEQFYVVWPVLIVVLAWLARRRRGTTPAAPSRGPSTGRLALGLLAIGVPSLAWSVHLTARDPGPAYFVTTTRLWELVIGALLAVAVHRAAAVGGPSMVPDAARRAVGWAGLGAIGVAAVTFGAGTPFPGVAALLPTLGAAAVLWAGSGDGAGRVRALEPATMQHLGALSYSLYLWHWPLVVVGTVVLGNGDGAALWWPTALVVAASSYVPAWLTYRLVERPLHTSSALADPRRAAVAGALCVAVGVGAGFAVHRLTPDARPVDLPPDAEMGAVALGDDPAHAAAGAPDDASDVVPAPVAAAADNADVYADGCHQDQDSADVVSCVYGDEDSPTVVALVGDSHAAQWQPALRDVAEANGWRLETYTKSACPFIDDGRVWLDDADRPYDSCTAWGDDVAATLAERDVDLVVTSSAGHYRSVVDGERLGRGASASVLADGQARTWTELEDAGVDVAVLIDTPVFGIDVPECVATHTGDPQACAVPREGAVAASAADVQHEAARLAPEADAVDLTDLVCPRAECSPVIGGVLVARDADHLTATYAETLAPALEEALVPLVEATGAG